MFYLAKRTLATKYKLVHRTCKRKDIDRQMAKLIISKPSGGKEDLPLVKPKYSLGRLSDNDVVLNDPDVSRHHCLLQLLNDEYAIEDLDSSNGTYLNSKKITRATLRHGDRIKVGHHTLSFQADDVSISMPQSDFTHHIDESYDNLMSQMTLSLPRLSQKADAGELKQHLQKEQKTFRLLLDLGNALSTEHSVEDVCQKAAKILLESTEAEHAGIYLLQEDQTTLAPIVSSSRDNIASQSIPMVLSRTITERILDERRGIVTSDALADERFSHGKSIAASRLRSVACAPLLGKGGTLGILYMQNNTEVGAFTQDDLRLLCAVASQIGLAIENAKFFEQLRETNENLEQLVEERTAALAETQMKLYQAEKIASLSRLVAGVAHEINNPLGALKSNLDLVTAMTDRIAADSVQNQNDADRLDGLAELGRTCTVACARIVSVVRSLSSFARLDEAAFKPADLNSGIQNVIQLMDPVLTQNVDIELKQGEIPPINCYPVLLNEAFMNLLVNACQAIEGSGQVTVETGCAGENIIITIRDSGCGIPSEHLQTIFDPGFTTKGRGVGVGLGLPIVYSAIKEHNGNIKVESEINQGSIFTISLPVR